MKLIGRTKELLSLNKLKQKSTASLVCVRGRRRIGKSRLIQYFSKSFKNFVEFQGLAPHIGSDNQKQLDFFAKTISMHFKLPKFEFTDWSEAFSTLARLTSDGSYLVFLDEISWLGKYDPDFAGKLKVAWDTEFKKNDKLILVLCGSVSTWIKKNILNNTGFVGRISLNLKITELSLSESLELIRGRNLNEYELIKILSLTGGVPKYLEEISVKETAEKNIERLLLNKSGFLFNEFEQIFNEIFEKKATAYRKMLIEIGQGAKTPKEIAQRLKLQLNGDFFEALDHLCESGFLEKNNTWIINTDKDSNLSQYRISDNYIHFYLKYVYPIRSRIERLPLKIITLKNWESIIGYQFQNLIYNNLEKVLELLEIGAEEITHVGPYFQNKNTKQNGCQVDLLIQTKFGNLYMCEIKCKKNIDASILDEINVKKKNLNYKKGFTVRPVLILCGDVAESVENSENIFKVLHFKDLIH